MKRDIYVVVLCMVVIMLYVPSAFAGVDAKIYAGYQCRETVPDTIYYTWGAALNKTDQTISVICPITHDASGIAGGWIRFVDQIPNSGPDHGDGITDVACYLRSYTRFSGATNNGAYGELRITSYRPYWPPPGLSQSHSLVKTFGPIPFEYNSDAYFMQCYIPGRYNGKMSGISSFRIEEHT